jgi:hypothetical protein
MIRRMCEVPVSQDWPQGRGPNGLRPVRLPPLRRACPGSRGWRDVGDQQDETGFRYL